VAGEDPPASPAERALAALRARMAEERRADDADETLPALRRRVEDLAHRVSELEAAREAAPSVEQQRPVAGERGPAAGVLADLQDALADERERVRVLVHELGERDALIARLSRSPQPATPRPAAPAAPASPRQPGGPRGGSLDELIERFETVRDRLAAHGVTPRPGRGREADG
jgi:hypothetical protein